MQLRICQVVLDLQYSKCFRAYSDHRNVTMRCLVFLFFFFFCVSFSFLTLLGFHLGMGKNSKIRNSPESTGLVQLFIILLITVFTPKKKKKKKIGTIKSCNEHVHDATCTKSNLLQLHPYGTEDRDFSERVYWTKCYAMIPVFIDS